MTGRASYLAGMCRLQAQHLEYRQEPYNASSSNAASLPFRATSNLTSEKEVHTAEFVLEVCAQTPHLTAQRWLGLGQPQAAVVFCPFCANSQPHSRLPHLLLPSCGQRAVAQRKLVKQI